MAFVIPVHNQASRIRSVLQQIRLSARESHEIVVIVDGCTDATREEVVAWRLASAAEAGDNLTTAITVVTTSQGVFETVADSIGVELSSAPYLIEVQADMIVTHVGFDKLIIAAFRQHPELGVLSGRGGHELPAHLSSRAKLTLLNRAARLGQRLIDGFISWGAARLKRYSPTLLEYRLSRAIGRVGNRVEADQVIPTVSQVWLAETVMRGPLAFPRRVWDEVGGFDTARFFLGDDDHDFCYRLYVDHSYVAGYMPISFAAPLSFGTTRARKSELELARYAALSNFYQHQQRDLIDRSSRGRLLKRRLKIHFDQD